MPTVEEVQELVETKGWEMHVHTGEVEILSSLLKEDEELVQSNIAYVKGVFGKLFTTNKRLIHIDQTDKTESYWYGDIQSLSTRKTIGMSGGHRDLILYDGTDERMITTISKDPFASLITYMMENVDLPYTKRVKNTNGKKQFILRKPTRFEHRYVTRLAWTTNAIPFLLDEYTSMDFQQALVLNQNLLNEKRKGRTTQSLIEEHLPTYEFVEVAISPVQLVGAGREWKPLYNDEELEA